MIINNGRIQGEIFYTRVSITKGSYSEISLYSFNNGNKNVGYKIINIYDFVNVDGSPSCDLSIQGSGYTLTKHPADGELYIISFTNNKLNDGKLIISAPDNILEIPIRNNLTVI